MKDSVLEEQNNEQTRNETPSRLNEFSNDAQQQSSDYGLRLDFSKEYTGLFRIRLYSEH